MAVGDITLNAKIATVECDATEHRITLNGMNCSLTNVGVEAVFLSMSGSDESPALARDGLQNDGEIQLGPNDSIPLPAEASFIRHQCGAGKVTKLWYAPQSG